MCQNEVSVEELIEFYKIANEYDYDSIFGFHSCDDIILFKWWNDSELWLSQKHMDTIRWKDAKFCLGDAGSVSYSKEFEFDSLLDLIEASAKEIKSHS